jgi:hypothetical protein
VYGAGNAGSALYRDLINNEKCHFKVICFYDDDIKLNVQINKKDTNNVYLTIDDGSLDHYSVGPFIHALATFGVKNQYSGEKGYIAKKLLITPYHKKVIKAFNDYFIFDALANYHDN